MLGYDLYSSALADILSEPSLSTPITVGLYAKWGSGKSFLLNKLRGRSNKAIFIFLYKRLQRFFKSIYRFFRGNEELCSSVDRPRIPVFFFTLCSNISRIFVGGYHHWSCPAILDRWSCLWYMPYFYYICFSGTYLVC